MVIRKEDQRLQVRDNVRGGQGRLENRHILEPEQMFGSASLLTEFYFDPGDGIGPHVHDTDAEVYYVLEGELTLTENGKDSSSAPATPPTPIPAPPTAFKTAPMPPPGCWR